MANFPDINPFIFVSVPRPTHTTIDVLFFIDTTPPPSPPGTFYLPGTPQEHFSQSPGTFLSAKENPPIFGKPYLTFLHLMNILSNPRL